MWVAILAFIVGSLPFILSRVVGLLGFGVVTYYGLDQLTVYFQDFVNTQIGDISSSGISADFKNSILLAIELSGILDGIQMILTAHSAAFGLGIMTKFTGIKS